MSKEAKTKNVILVEPREGQAIYCDTTAEVGAAVALMLKLWDGKWPLHIKIAMESIAPAEFDSLEDYNG